MFKYFAFGLNIHSELELPQLSLGSGAPDVCIYLEQEPCPIPCDPNRKVYLNVSRDSALLFVNGLGIFRLEEGKRIFIHPLAGVEPWMLQVIVVGTVAAILCYQRNKLVMHCSAVRLKSGPAVAFMGDSGMGKSTIAAAMIARGHHLVTDDLAIIESNGAGQKITPGYPILKLHALAVESSKINMNLCPHLPKKYEKFCFHVSDKFDSSPCSLKHVLILRYSDNFRLEPSSFEDAFKSLICNTPPTMWKRKSDRIHFDQCDKLLRHVKFTLFERHRSLENLQDQAEQIEKYLTETA